MQLTTITTAAALAFAFHVQAYNTAFVKNHCTQPIYIWSVADADDSWGPFTIDPHTTPYNETFRTRASGGVAIKIATDYNDGVVPNNAITQFEYTYVPGSDLWYDISNINGYPFEDGGLELVPSTQSCNTITCSAGTPDCKAAYNAPSDNWATTDCADGTDLTLTLCASQAPAVKSRDAAPASAPEAAPEPAPEAAPEAAAEAAAAPVPHAHGEKHLHNHQRRARRGTLGLRK